MGKRDTVYKWTKTGEEGERKTDRKRENDREIDGKERYK